MQFWRGRIWVFIALLAFCNSSPLAARLCAPAVAMSAPMCDEVLIEGSDGEKVVAPCCCESADAPFLVCVAAPLPTSEFWWPSATSYDAILPPVYFFKKLLVRRIEVQETDLPPPRQRFDSFRSCRAPPLNQA